MRFDLLFFAPAVAAVISCPAMPVKVYVPAGPGDSRSPCTMLNTMANHNYLPHDGRNITADMIEKVFMEVFNLEAPFAQAARIFSNATGMDAFDLEDLNDPHIIQHVASITRPDSTPQDPHLSPDIPRIERFLADSDTAFVTVESIAKTRARDNSLSDLRGMSDLQRLATNAEAAFILTMMMDEVPAAADNPPASAYQAPKDRLHVWLTQERLPTEFGWKPPTRRVLAADMTPPMNYVVADVKEDEQGS